MDKEFHYWVTGLVAEDAGFPPKDCRTIAYSSQYTDDNNREIEVYDSEFDVFPSYVSQVSQTIDIAQPKAEIMKIYPLFHFIPGDQTAVSPRKDGKTHPLLTTPDSPLANNLMRYTLQNSVSKYLAKDKSCLHRIGIASHSYVDTWAHQNFIGWYNDLNGIPGVPFLNIGHFDAGHNPDQVNHTWQDGRLNSSGIDNNSRFLAAAERLYHHLRWFCEQVNLPPKNGWESLQEFLKETWKLKQSDRTDCYRKYSKSLKGYDDRLFEAGAFTLKNIQTNPTKTELYVWIDVAKKNKTDWYKFQEAVKSHIVDAATILRPAFNEARIQI